MTKNQIESLHTARVGRVPVSLAPLLLFAGVVVFLAIGLTLNPREVPSPLIGKPVPEFALPPVEGRALGLASSDLRREVSLVNVFASWCVACKEEHHVFLQLQREGFVPVHGLNYKDRPEDAARWLDTLGDPYTRTGADLDGRVAIDGGVYGVPETFVVDRDGRIAYKHIGPVTPGVLEKKLRPLVASLRSGDSAAEARRGGAQ
ncbi:MAG: DsbE family thiol:disulfide interchange protein [Burkholderiales bacterium]|nr:DsbE family thiol:disulfide interchange protein [Burkholderiales bacterium]